MTTQNIGPKLAEAIAAAQAKLKPALKDSVNPHFRSGYASLQSVWDSARPVLEANGLSVIQTFNQSDGDLMHINTTLLHKSGEYIVGTLSMKPQQSTPQGIGSAITYARRYSLAAVLGIVVDEDDDGNEGSKKPEPKAKPESRPAPAPEPYKIVGEPCHSLTVAQLREAAKNPEYAKKLDAGLSKYGLLAFDELSETDAQKLLKWATAPKS